MLGKNEIKYINSLKVKKYRYEEQAFLAEGKKLVLDLIKSGLKIKTIVGKENWLTGLLKSGTISPDMHLIPANDQDIKKVSSLKSPQGALAVVEMPQSSWQKENLPGTLSLALDNLQDPGNMGTIVRLADWFGIRHIFCSKNSVDIYNTKVVQASMGALANVQVHYVILPDFLQEFSSSENFGIYGAFQEGKPVYSEQLTPNGILVLGNEGNGITPETEAFIPQRLTIPDYPGKQTYSESLNVATAAGILISEFRRLHFTGKSL